MFSVSISFSVKKRIIRKNNPHGWSILTFYRRIRNRIKYKATIISPYPCNHRTRRLSVSLFLSVFKSNWMWGKKPLTMKSKQGKLWNVYKCGADNLVGVESLLPEAALTHSTLHKIGKHLSSMSKMWGMADWNDGSWSCVPHTYTRQALALTPKAMKCALHQIVFRDLRLSCSWK